MKNLKYTHLMDKSTEQAEMLANRVKKRLKHLKKWAKRLNIEAFRLYDRDIPEIPPFRNFFTAACKFPVNYLR